jgi:hypothetical protein
MKAAHRRFSLSVYFYLVTFFLLLGFLPTFVAAGIGRTVIGLAPWFATAIWPALIIASWAYARNRCASDLMPFGDGLLWVTASMMTGWLYISFIFVLPVLLVVFGGQS